MVAEISLLFNEKTPLKETLRQVLESLMAYGDFSLAEAWLIGSDHKQIRRSVSISRTKQMNTFYRETAIFDSFYKGEGLPGITWQKKQVQLWEHVGKNKNFIRRGALEKAGLNSVYGMPLIYNDEVSGVLVFGHKKEEAKTNNVTAFFDSFSSHLSADIKRKQLEQDLNQIFSLSPDVICIVGTDGYLKKINPAMCSLIEYSEEELLAIPFRNFIHPDDKEKTAEEIYNLSVGRTTQYFENRLICKSGKSKWLVW